jgi:hypothetical protein
VRYWYCVQAVKTKKRRKRSKFGFIQLIFLQIIQTGIALLLKKYQCNPFSHSLRVR